MKSTKGGWRHYNSEEEFADSYVDDFVLLRPELKAAKTAEDFVHIMGQTGYFDPVSDNEPAYLDSVKKYGAAHPNTEGYEESEEEETADGETPTRNEEMDKMISDLIEKEGKPLFNLEEDSEVSKNFFKNFVEDKQENATAEEIAKYGELLDSFYKDGELQNTKANRMALAEALGGDTLKNLGQENLNSKVEEYRKFQQSQINPLQREVEKLEEKQRKAQERYDGYRADKNNFDTDIAKTYRQQVIDSQKELEEKVSELERATTHSRPRRVDNLQNEISELASRLNARQKDLETITQERAKADLRAEDWQASKDTFSNLNWREGLTQRQVDILQQALETKNSELEKARTYTARDYRIDNLHNEIAQLENRKAEIQKNNARANRLEGEFQYLEPTNNNAKELESIQQQIDSRTAKLERLKNKFIQPENNQPSAEIKPVEKFTATLNQGAKKAKGDDKILKLLEYEGDEIKFNPVAKNSVMAGIVEDFAKQKLPEDKKFFKPMFEYDKFKRTKNNLEEVAKKYGDEIQDFGQSELQKKLEEVKSRYKIERPVEREAVKVLPEEKEPEQPQSQKEKPQEKSFAQTQEKTKQILSDYAQDKNSDAEIIKQAQDLMRQAVANNDNKNYFKIYGALRDRDIKAMQKMLSENAEQSKSLPLSENIQRMKSRNEKLKSRLQTGFSDVVTKIQPIQTDFEVGKYKTAKGENLPTVKFQKVSKEKYLELKETAKKHGGYYKKAAGGFVFKNEDDRNKFMDEVNGETKSAEKASTPLWEKNQQLKDLNDDLKDLQKSLDSALEKRDKKAVAEVEDKIADLKEKISAKKAEIDEYKKSPEHIEDLKKDLKDNEEWRDKIQKKIETDGRTKKRTQILEETKKKILALEKEIAELENPTQEESFIEEEEKFPIKKVGDKFVVSGGKNPKALKKVAEDLGGKYVSKDNNFAFSTLKDAQDFLKGKADAENAPSGEYETGITGTETVAETDGHKKIKMRFKIVSASALNTSHKLKGDDVFKNESYPEKLQPRNRNDASLKMQVIKMRNNLDTDHLGENILLNEGAPVVREDGVVLNGNGRAMAIESAYNEGKADNYKQFLTDNAAKFGFKATEIEKIEKPVLIREVAQELDDQTTTAIIKSRAGGASFKSSEQAMSDAESIQLSDFDDYKPNEDGDISTAGNYEFRDKILNKIATENENTAYRVENSFGEIEHSGEAIRRIKNAIYALAYSDYNLISKNAESTTDDIKNISSAAEKAAVDFARLKLKQREGKADEYDVGGVIAETIKTYDAAKRDTKFKSIREFINQDANRMFDARQQAIYDAMEVFDAYKRNSERIKDFLKDIARRADRKENPDQTGLNFDNDFESYRQARIDEIVRAAKDKVLQSNELDLFAETAETTKAELAEGYKTESGRSLQDADRNEFILKPDGSKDFGQIDEKIIAKANAELEKLNDNFRLKNAPIRLQVGTEDTIDENGETVDGFGYKHILEHIDEIKARGFEDITSYVEHILNNFNQVRKSSQKGNRIILYCKGDQSKGLMPIDLELEKTSVENFYTIVTAYPRRKAKKEDTLLVDTRPTNVSTDTASVPHLENSNNKSGVTTSRDIAESNGSSAENITQTDQNSKENKLDLEAKTTSNGATIFYSNGKKIPKQQAQTIKRERISKITDSLENLLKSFESTTGITPLSVRDNNKFSVTVTCKDKVDLRRETSVFQEGEQEKFFERLEEAIRYAKYVYGNSKQFDEFELTEAAVHSKSAFRYAIDKNGVEKTNDDETKKILENLNTKQKQDSGTEYAKTQSSKPKNSTQAEQNISQSREENQDSKVEKVLTQFEREMITRAEAADKITKILAENGEENAREQAEKIIPKSQEKVAEEEIGDKIKYPILEKWLKDVQKMIQAKSKGWKSLQEKVKAMDKMTDDQLAESALGLLYRQWIYDNRDTANKSEFSKRNSNAEKLLESYKAGKFSPQRAYKLMDTLLNGDDNEVENILGDIEKVNGKKEITKKELWNQMGVPVIDMTSTDEILDAGKEDELAKKNNSDTENDSKAEKPKRQRIFATQEEANKELKAAFGINDEEIPKNKFVNFFDDSDENIERLKAKWKKEINKTSAMPMFNPELWTTALELGGIYIQRGINNFATWTKEMTKALGEESKVWHSAVWESLKTMPEKGKFNDRQISAVANKIGGMYEDGKTSLEEIQKDFERALGENYQSELEPIIKSTFKGIEKFFADNIKEEEKINESSELGESGRTDGGHQVRESELRTATDEETRQERRDKVSEKLSGQQRQNTTGTEKGDNGTNAANARPDAVQSERIESGRTGEGTGVRRSEGVVQSAAGTERGSSTVSSNAENVEFSGHNFKITDDSEIGTGDLKTKFKQNIDAIKLLKQLESEGRKATPSEQEILSKFNGWGTVAGIFTEKENAQLKEILTDEEYDKASKVTTNAFYTSPKIAKAMWKGLERLGFKGGRILDPATGSGIFFGTMPSEIMTNSELTGVEYDSLTGRIAQQLYQKAAIDIIPYQNRLMPNNYYDLAITNVPFDNVRIYADTNYSKQAYMLHNFYFAKTIDKVRPGGLVAFITSQGTMRSETAEAKKLRAELNGKADLIAAFKLPNTAFKDNAGTEVTTDILILQKRLDPKKPSPYAQNWNELVGIDAERRYDGGSYFVSVDVNNYFRMNPENMIGKPIAATTQRYGELQLALDGTGLDVAEELAKLIEKLPENIYTPVQHNTQDTLKNTFAAIADASQREGTFSIKDNKVVQNIDGKLVEVPKRITVNRNKKQVEIDNPAIPVIKDFIPLQKTLENLLKAQLSPETTDAKLSELRERLNKKYDDFVKNHGYLNTRQNLKILDSDPSYGKVAAIENYKEDKKNKTVSVSKGDIFYKRTASPLREVNSADNALDALRLSLSRHGKIDTDYMSKLTGKNLDALTKELGDLIYKNPETNLIELAEEYLSGNVREKLTYAKEIAKHNPEFKRNVEALEKVLPVDLTDKEIFPHMGANWINEKYYYDFIKHLIGESENVHITRDKFTGKWKVSGWIPNQQNIQWEIRETRQDFITLFEGALNHRYPNITSNKVQLKEQMAEAKDKIDKITEEFDKWIFSDEGRKADLVKTYNEKYNSEVERIYDGSHLELPGLNEEVKNKLYPHQKDAIWRVLQGKNTLLAHCVGAGKTWEMVISAMEMKRIGMINKPLFTVPNNIVEQFAREFRIAYPNANLLVLTSNQLGAFKNEDGKETKLERMTRLNNRKRTLYRIVTGDWDGIIISHNLFERLPMSKEGLRQYSRDGEKIDKAAIIQMTAESKDDVKESAKRIKAAEERIEKNYNLDTKEIIMPFEELGIDQIFVDESDMFKNLGFETSNYNPSDPNPDNRVVGVSTADAQRSQDLYTKARWLSAQRNGGGLVFASGTPVSNTLNEIYTIQRYLDPEMLAENDWKSFDEWANHFGKTVETTEADAAGNYVSKRRLNLNNLPALINSFRKIADIKMFEDLPHLQENVPKLKGGERKIITIEPTNAFNEYKKILLERNEDLHKARTKEERGDDNFLKIAGDFRKASLDMRLIDPSYSEEESGGKINAVCDNIFAKFDETTDVKGTQLVFLDLSTPKAKKQKANGEDMTDEESALDEETSKDEITVYDRIKKGLVRRGIPANQIAFVHEAKNANQRQALFDKVNEGDIRVIIGSTAKMGAGTNFQKHLVALHHVDCPWRPRDIEQREGRILRSGNLNKEVEIFTYVTKGSYDSINWALVTRKQNMIDSLMRGDPTVTEVEDVSDIGASYSDIAAAGEDNPLKKELREVEGKVLRLKSSQKRFLKNQKENQLRAARLRKNAIPALEWRIKNLQEDIKDLPNLTGENFKMKLGDKVYTKFGEARIAFDKFMRNFKKLSPTKIGEIGGFNIKAHVENFTDLFTKKTFIQLEKNGSYEVDNSLDSVRNFISGNKGTSIIGRLDKEKSRLDKLNAELAGLNEKLQQPFDKQAELSAAEERLAEIQRQLKDRETSEASQQSSTAEKSDNRTSPQEKNYPSEIKGNRIKEIVYDSFAQDKIVAVKVGDAVQDILKQDFESINKKAKAIRTAIKDALLSYGVPETSAGRKSVEILDELEDELDISDIENSSRNAESFEDDKVFVMNREGNEENISKDEISKHAQKILKYLKLDQLQPNKNASLGKTYGKMNNDGTFSVNFDKEIADKETSQAVEKIAYALSGNFDSDDNIFTFEKIEDVATFFKAVRTAFYGKKDKINTENKKTSNVEGIELPEGYKTETGKSLAESNVQDFIVDGKGNKNLGEISADIEEKTDGIVKAAPIRLQVGNEGFGFIHINLRHAEEIQNKGYDNAVSYIKKILENVNKIYSRADTGNLDRFILCSEGAKGHSSDFIPIDLELEKGEDDFYNIVTAYPNRAKKIEGILIFDDSTNSSPATATGSLVRSTDDKSGVGDQSYANAKISNPSAENISQSEQGDKEKIKFALDKLTADYNFSDEELKWIKRFGKYIENHGFINTSVFDEVGTAFKSAGGFSKINQIFNGKLSQIIGELNIYLKTKSQSEDNSKNSDKETLYAEWQVDKFPAIKDLIDNNKLKAENPDEEQRLIVALGALQDKYSIKFSPLTKEYDQLNRKRNAEKERLMKLFRRPNSDILAEEVYQEYEKFLQEQTEQKNSITYDNKNDAEEKELIKAILDAPVGTKIISRNGIGEPVTYEITGTDSNKKIRQVDESGEKVGNYPDLILNRANVKKYFGAGREHGYKLRTGEVTVVLPENHSEQDSKENKVPTLKSKDDTVSTFLAFIVNKLKSAKSRRKFITTMNQEKKYGDVTETRREHIERIFKEHPNYQVTAVQFLGKDIYNSKQTNQQIFHGNLDEFLQKHAYVPTLEELAFEYVTVAEAEYAAFLKQAKDAIGYDEIKGAESQPHIQDMLNIGKNKTKYSGFGEISDKAIPKPKSVEECKDYYELKKFWQENHNVKVDNAIKNLYFDAVKKFLAGFESVINKLPFLSNGLFSIDSTFIFSVAKIVRSANGYATSLRLSLKFFSEEKAKELRRRYIDGSKRNTINIVPIRAGNTDVFKQAGAHEAGHLIEQFLKQKLGVIGSNALENKTRLRFVNWVFDSLDEESKQGKTVYGLKEEISDYASMSNTETIAEAVSDVFFNGDKAATFSKAIWSKIELAFNSDEWLKYGLLSRKPNDKFLAELEGYLDPESVLKWINAREKAQDTDKERIKNYVQKLLSDKDLAEEVHDCKNLSEVKELLEEHIIDVDTFLEVENWYDERINEIVKDSFYRNGVKQLGADIVDGKVKYPDDETRNAVVKFLQTMTNPSAKFAGHGNLVKMFVESKILSPDKLNGKQKKWQDFGEDLGLKVVWLEAHKDLKGAVEGGTIYLNARNNKDISKTFYHEQFHMLSALNPVLHNEMLEHFSESFTAKQLDEYRKENQREDLSDDEVIEEILSDNFEQVQSRAKLLQEMSKENPSLLKRFIAYLKNLAEKFVSIFRSPQGGMTREQRDAFIQKFNALAGSLKDARGNKLFTTYKGGKELRFANGKEIEKVPLKFAAQNTIDNIEQKTDNVENHLTDNQKTNLFNTIKSHIDNYISEQVKNGKKETDIAQELTSENSRHRAKTLGALQATLRDFENRANDKEHRRLTVERIDGKKKLSDAKIDEKYKSMIDNLREMVNYGGVLYHEIALNRAGNEGMAGSSIQLRTWADAERQRDERESGTGNRIDGKHSEEQGAFSLNEKISDAMKADSSVGTLIKQLGGKIVNGKLEADAKTRARIESQFSKEGWKNSIAWHGTPHDFDKFTLDAIGTGEGAQIHGWGLYFANDREVSEGYKNLRGANGRLFQVDIPDADVMIDEGKRWRNQPKKVKAGIKKLVSELSDDERGIESRETILDGIMNDPIGRGGFIYNRLSSILGGDKAASERLNKYGIKGITYEGGLDGRCYVVFDDKAIKILEKYSKQGNGDTTIANFVDDKDLTTQQKLIKDFGDRMGVHTVFFRNNNGDFHGAHNNGVTYLNVNSKVPLNKVFWHEALHWLKSNNEKLYNELAKAADLTDEQLQNYLDKTGRQDVKGREEITEEILADSMHQLFDRVKDRNVLQKVIAWLQDTLQKFKEMFRNPKGGLKTEQYKKLADKFKDIATSLTDEDGNKIFRFNPKTKSIELVNGENFDETAKVVNKKTIDNEADMNENIENEIFDKQLDKNIKANVEKVISKAIEDLDLKKINSVMALRDIRDGLQYFTKLNTNYHFAKGMRDTERARKLAAWLEYARRRFDNDERIRERIAVSLGNDGRQGRVYRTGQNTLSERNDEAIRRRLRKSNGTIERYVTAEHIESHNEFLRMYNDKARYSGEPEIKIYPREGQEKHSVKGAFSLDNAKVAKNLGGKWENGEWTFTTESASRAFEKHLQNVENNFEGTKFSVANNDNSTESIRQIIKNKLFGTNTHNGRTRKRINQALEKLSGYKIAAGHIADGIDIVVKDVQKVIRTRNAYDYERILPEVGTKIAERLNLNPSEEMKNYIAKWILTGAPNDTSSEAKEFQRAMSANEDYYRDQRIDIRNIFKSELDKDIWEQLQGRMAFGKEDDRKLSQKAKDFGNKLREQLVEELLPVQKLVESVEEETGKKLKDSENPLVSFRLYRGAAGIAKIMIEESSEGVKKALAQLYPNVKFDNFKTMFDILKSVNALEDENKRKKFSVYVAACHVKDIHTKNHEIEKEQEKLKEKIQKLKDELEISTDKKKSKELEKKIKKANERLEDTKIYETPYTEAECDKILSEGKAEFEQAQKDLVRFSNTQLAIAKESGLVSEKAFFELLKGWKNYVPLFRVFDENEDVSFGDSLKHMTGSSRDLIDPLLSIGRNTYSTIKRAEKNKAKISLANLAREGGVGKIIEEVDNKTPNVGTVITFYEDGKKKYLDTDPSVVKAVNNLSPVQMDWFMRFLRIGTTLVRNLATVYNPNFALRNLVRDPQDAYLYGKYGYFSPMDYVKGYLRAFTDTATGIKSAWKKDDDYQEWMAFGGAQASFWSVDRDYAQSSIDQLTKGKYKRFKSVTGFFELFKILGEYSELGTRIGHFKRVKAELAKQNGGKIDRNILVTAALESRDLMDFARGGKSSRNWNVLSAFANAQIQGWDKFYRTFDIRKAWSKDENVRKEWQRAMIRLAIGGILPALLTFMLNGDEDWYKKDLQDWEKQTHWIIGEHIRIPKGADVGIRFVSNATETLLNNLKNNEPVKFAKLFKPLWDSLPDFMPTAVQPIFECAANYDMFTNAPIVPYRLQRMPEHLQYDSRTSALAKFLGETAGLSPQKIDHFLYGYTANAGKLFTKSVDIVVGDKEFSPALDWYPLIGGFFRVPYKNPKVINDFYEKLDAQTKLHNEYKTTHKMPKGYNPALYKRLTQTQKKLSKLSKQERAILENQSIGSNAKESRQEMIQKQRVSLVEKFMR